LTRGLNLAFSVFVAIVPVLVVALLLADAQMEFIVRPATVEDAPAIAAIHVRVWQYAYRGIVPDSFLDSLSSERRTDQWMAALSQPGPKVFV
jgi:hypothetical protein